VRQRHARDARERAVDCTMRAPVTGSITTLPAMHAVVRSAVIATELIDSRVVFFLGSPRPNACTAVEVRDRRQDLVAKRARLTARALHRPVEDSKLLLQRLDLGAQSLVLGFGRSTRPDPKLRRRGRVRRDTVGGGPSKAERTPAAVPLAPSRSDRAERTVISTMRSGLGHPRRSGRLQH